MKIKTETWQGMTKRNLIPEQAGVQNKTQLSTNIHGIQDSNRTSSIPLPACTKTHRSTTSQSDIPFLRLPTDLEG